MKSATEGIFQHERDQRSILRDRRGVNQPAARQEAGSYQ